MSTRANGLRELVNRTMEDEGLSLTQATNNVMKRIRGDARERLDEVRTLQDMREEMGTMDATDVVSRAIDQEIQIAQLEKIRGNGGNGHGGFDLDKLMGFMVLQDSLDTRAYKRELRALEIERAKKLMEGGLSPDVEAYIQTIRDEHARELAELREQIKDVPAPAEQRALPAPSGMTPDEVVNYFNDAITEVATPIVETLREMQGQIEEAKAGGHTPTLKGDVVAQLDKELTAYKQQQERIERLASTMGWKKAETSEALGRLASRHEVIADIQDGVDIIKYADDQLGISDKFRQLFGSPPAEKSLAEFDHWQKIQTTEPMTEKDQLIKDKGFLRKDIEQLRLCTYDDIRRYYDRGDYTEAQTKQLMEWKAIICDDQPMLARIRGTDHGLPAPPEDLARCECGAVLVDGLCPKCEGGGAAPAAEVK